jgi:predicted glycosyltransferase
MATNKGKIWIDLDNSPHVPFFNPIMEELKKRGYSVMLTARDCFQVCALADFHKLSYQRIGRHYGKHKIMKGVGLIYRAIQMAPAALRGKPDLALSHGSRSQTIICNLLQIPNVLMTDYEHAKAFPCVRPDWMIVPTSYPEHTILSRKERVGRY